LNKPVEPLLTTQFVLLLVTSAAVGLSFSTYFLLPKYLAVELDADAASIGGVTAVTLLASVIGMPIGGVQIDRHGRRPFIVTGALLFAAACAGFLFVDRVGPLLWSLRVVQGLAWPFFYLGLSTLATDLAPRSRLGEAIGLFGAVMISTNALGPALAEWGAHAFGWPTVFGATVVAALLAAVLTRWLREPHRPPSHEASTTFRALVARPGLRRVLLVTVLVGWTFSSMFTFYQPWALVCGFREVSLYLAAFSVCAMVVRVALGGIADRFGRLRVAKLVLLLYCVAPLSLVWLPALGLAPTGALLGIAHGIFFPTLNAVAVEFSAADERGKAMGAYNTAFNLGFASGSYLLGHVAIMTGYPTIFVIAAATCVLACVVLASTVAPGSGRTPPQAASVREQGRA
jgi:MFS family permease